MELTWLGVVLIPFGIVMFFVIPNWLQHCAVFFIPFTASSVLNSASGVPLSPFQLFGALFMLNRALVVLNAGRLRVRFGGDKSLTFLILFASVTVVSMIMPIIIDGKLQISTNQLANLYLEPLRLTDSNIKYPLPVIFGTLFATFLVFTTNTFDKIRTLINVFAFSSVVVALWGIFQFLCDNVLGIKYPDYLFNNVKIESVQGFLQRLDVDGDIVARVSSVAHEPSIFAKYLLTVIPIVIVAVWLKQPLFGAKRDKAILLLLIIVVLLTTSTIAYVGTIAALVTCAVVVGHYRGETLRIFRWALLMGVIVFTVLITFQFARELLSFAIIDKGDSGSVIERMLSITNSWEYFLQYPILGVGWAMVTSHDLIVNLLVSTGVIGLVVFCSLIFYVVKRTFNTLYISLHAHGIVPAPIIAIGMGLLTSLIILIFNGVLTGLEFYLGYFYFVSGILIATNIVIRRQIANSKLVRRVGF